MVATVAVVVLRNSTADRDRAQFALDIETERELDELSAGAALTLVYVHADWCAPCIEMGPVITALAQAEVDRLRVVRIDADRAPRLVERLRATPLPLLIHVEQGREVKRTSGSKSADYLREWLGLRSSR